MALADTLNLPKTAALLGGQGMPKTPKNYVGLAEKAPVEAELTEAQVKAEKDIGMADIGIKRAEQEQKIQDLEGQQVLAQKAAKDIRALPEREVLKTKREEFAEMTFAPTKDNAQDLASLFSLVNVIGMAVGGGGKQNAQQAMYAMNGMLEGYQKGRADLYRKEKDSFDKNFKSMQESVKTLEKDYEEAVKMYQYDKEAGEIARKLALARSGSPLFKAMEDRVGMVGTLSAIKELRSSVDKGVTLQNNLQAKADAEANAERRSREAMAQRERIAKEQANLRQKLATIAASGKGQGTLKPGAKVTEGYIADNILKADVDGLVKDLSNPALQQQIKDNRIEAFLTEESKVLNQVLAKEIPPELQQFLTKVRDIRNNYYLNISGKAVTGGEALRNYGTVPQPGDEPSVMVNKLAGMSGRISDSITLKKQLFGLPNLSLNPGTKPNLKPGEDYAVGSQPGTYEMNQVITLGGKKYKVIGLDDPSDPDLEEIK
jgi:hypothetical protein